jgi:hypothetical protein
MGKHNLEVAPSLRADKAARHSQLCELIRLAIEQDGQEAEGRTWAIKSKADWAELVGVSLRTIHTLIQIPPIQFLDTAAEISDASQTHGDGQGMASSSLGSASRMKRVIALRIDAIAPGKVKPPKHLANIMANIFEDATKRRPDRNAYGCLIGLAESLPEGFQVDVFRAVLRDWSGFMGLVKTAHHLETDGNPIVNRFYDHPVIPLIRKYHMQASDSYLYDFQEKHPSKPLPFEWRCPHKA